ncbi:universal stress protein [Ramlibacter sp. AW1]|uniref:Universal stress protein n=1 Tax=Ramlibacter aurantiacus TaxID=2801330 RepID=A0A936ZEW4_9BURK|nr:universal stress protein [Ramlibacter aurantiacus]MBL0419008.1 universal stress protein [Ramlibacter aurantiacus]
MYKRIMVAVDGSDPSNQALAAALQLAAESGGQVRLVHVLDELDFVSGYGWAPDLVATARRQAGELLQAGERRAEAAGVPVHSHLIDAPGERVGDLIARDAEDWDADLLVTGTHGRRGVARAVLGSGAEQILRAAPVPVLVVRSGDPLACD